MQHNESLSEPEAFKSFTFTGAHKEFLDTLDREKTYRYVQSLQNIERLIFFNPEIEITTELRYHLSELRQLGNYLERVNLALKYAQSSK